MELKIEHKEKVIVIIHMFLPDAKIYLFGSYARGDFNRLSDVDIAIDTGEKIPFHLKGQIIEMINALNLVQRVDIVDFQRAPVALKESILKEGFVWAK